MKKDNTVSLTFALAYLCQCGFPLDELTRIPTEHTAIEVIWLANTSHVLIDMAENPRVMTTLAFRTMIKTQYAQNDMLMFKDANFNQMLVAENGRFIFTPLNGKNLEQIICQQNSCNIQLNTLFNNMASKEQSIL